MTDLNHLTATEALRKLQAGSIKAEDLVAACIERIRSRDPQVQAWVHLEPAAAALARARAIDQSADRRRLAGLPIAVKDVIDTGDMPTQYNSPIYRNHRPRVDAACVANARREDAIVLGKTVTTEFASRVPGPTRNPHNPAHTPGGSSSGSAAAVADFMVPLAFGTQTGGSVIRPSAYCGAVGYKPSFGTINCAGMKHLSESLDTIGVIARAVADCALLVNAISGRELPDFDAAPASAPRIALCRTSRWQEASAATHAVLERTASALSKNGAQVREIELPAHFDRLYDDQPVISGVEAARAMMPEYLAHRELLSEHMRSQVETYADLPRAQYSAAMRHVRECRREFTAFKQDAVFDVLLTPSAPDEAPTGLESTGSAIFNRNWTLLGVPCMTLPAGRGPQGLPLGIQLVGDYDEDERLLRVAEWVRRKLE